MKLQEELKEAAKCRGWDLASRPRLMVLPLRNFTASAQHLGFTTHGQVLKCPVRMALVQGQDLREERGTGAVSSTASFLCTHPQIFPLRCRPGSKYAAQNIARGLQNTQTAIFKYKAEQQSMQRFSFSLPQGSNNYLNTTLIMYSIKSLQGTKAQKQKPIPVYVQQNATQLTKYHKTQWEH